MAFDATKSALSQLIGEKIYMRSPEAQRTREQVEDLQTAQANAASLQGVWRDVNITDTESVLEALQKSSAIAPGAYGKPLINMILNQVAKTELEGKQNVYADLIEKLSPGGMNREERALSASMATRTGLPAATFPPLNEPRLSVVQHTGGGSGSGGDSPDARTNYWIKNVWPKYEDLDLTPKERSDITEAQTEYVETGTFREDLLPIRTALNTAQTDQLEGLIIGNPEFKQAAEDLGYMRRRTTTEKKAGIKAKELPDMEAMLSAIASGSYVPSPELQGFVNRYQAAVRVTPDSKERKPLGGF